MPYPILEVVAKAPLELTPTTRIHSGSFRIGPTGSVLIYVPGQPPEEFVFFLPDAPPLAPGDPEPSSWGEVFIVQAVVSAEHARPLGAARVTTEYLPDPRGGDTRWLAVRGLAHAMGGLVLGYRVTIQSRELR